MIINSTNDTKVKTSLVTERMTINVSSSSINLILDNMYTKPHSSMVRELACNSVDSHNQAKNPNPYYIKPPTVFDPVFSLRDFGTGLDSEEVSLYLNTLYKTSKDDTNDQIGGFGLGAKSPFALVSSFSLTTYKDGLAYKYIWYKDEEKVPVLVSQGVEKTTEPNGVRYDVPLAGHDVEQVYEACGRETLCLNIKPIFVTDINDLSTVTSIDNLTLEIVKETDDYIVTNESSQMSYGISIAGVLYNSLDRYNSRSRDLHLFYKSKVYLKVPIGQLKLHDTRESILDTYENKTYLNKLVEERANSIRAEATEELNSRLEGITDEITTLQIVSTFGLEYSLSMNTLLSLSSTFKSIIVGLDKEVDITPIRSKRSKSLYSLISSITNKDLVLIKDTPTVQHSRIEKELYNNIYVLSMIEDKTKLNKVVTVLESLTTVKFMSSLPKLESKAIAKTSVTVSGIYSVKSWKTLPSVYNRTNFVRKVVDGKVEPLTAQVIQASGKVGYKLTSDEISYDVLNYHETAKTYDTKYIVTPSREAAFLKILEEDPTLVVTKMVNTLPEEILPESFKKQVKFINSLTRSHYSLEVFTYFVQEGFFTYIDPDPVLKWFKEETPWLNIKVLDPEYAKIHSALNSSYYRNSISIIEEFTRFFNTKPLEYKLDILGSVHFNTVYSIAIRNSILGRLKYE